MPVHIKQLTLDIRPESDIYGTYQRLDYDPWTAIAEFVDNSTGNYFLHEDELREAAGEQPYLVVKVNYDNRSHKLTISDNARGMELEEFERAIQLAKPPPIVGRSEFGMGLKTAACWLGPKWKVISKQVGSTMEYSCEMDIHMLRAERPREVTINQRELGPDKIGEHYTRVEVYGLNEYERVFKGRTLTKIKSTLGSMYRRDIDNGEIKILFNGDPISHKREKVKHDGNIPWTKNIDITVLDRKITGRLWLFETGKAAEAGFHLFRRNRLIQGGTREGWKPHDIFGAPNSFMSQRIYAELDMDDWPISHTKNKIEMIGEYELAAIAELQLASQDYIDESKIEKGKRGKKDQHTREAIETEISGIAEEIGSNSGLIAEMIINEQGNLPNPSHSEAGKDLLWQSLGNDYQVIEFTTPELPVVHWKVRDEDELGDHFVDVGYPQDDDFIRIMLNREHPFFQRRVGDNTQVLRTLIYWIAVDAYVDRQDKKAGGLEPDIRRKLRDKYLAQIEVDHDSS